MHITEGIITGVPALAFTGVSLGLVGYGAVKMKLGKDEIEERVQYAMDLMQIKHLANRPIHHLSGGEKKGSPWQDFYP